MIAAKPAPDAIITASGRWIRPLADRPGDISIEDIAHATSNMCRFTGHTKKFYSVAQHSYLVSEDLPREFALWGLLHDASEYALADIARPIKDFDADFGNTYRKYERQLMRVIARHFNIGWPMPPEVARADDRILYAEMRDLMPNDPPEGVDISPKRIVPATPVEAKNLFLWRYSALTEHV